MPNRNGTGPEGCGPRTGRGCGRCGRGMSFGMDVNRGRGLAKYYDLNPYKNKDEQIKDYEAYRNALQEELEDMDNALASLKKSEQQKD